MWLTTDELNFVPALAPDRYETNATFGTTAFPCKLVQLSKYASMVAIVSLHAPSTVAIWVNSYSTGTPGGAGAGTTYPLLNVNYRYSTATISTNLTGSGSEVLSARVAMGTTAISVTAAPTTLVQNYYIEVKSDDLLNGYPYVGIALSTSLTASTGICVNYVLKPRYPQKDMMTAIS